MHHNDSKSTKENIRKKEKTNKKKEVFFSFFGFSFNFLFTWLPEARSSGMKESSTRGFMPMLSRKSNTRSMLKKENKKPLAPELNTN